MDNDLASGAFHRIAGGRRGDKLTFIQAADRLLSKVYLHESSYSVD